MSEVGVESLQEPKVRWDYPQPLDMTCSYTWELLSAALGCTTSVQGQASPYSSKCGERVLQSRNPECLGFMFAYFILFYFCV